MIEPNQAFFVNFFLVEKKRKIILEVHGTVNRFVNGAALMQRLPLDTFFFAFAMINIYMAISAHDLE